MDVVTLEASQEANNLIKGLNLDSVADKVGDMIIETE